MKKIILAAVAAVAMVFAAPVAAQAHAPSYSVTTDGVSLNAGEQFQAHGHVNIRWTSGSAGIHFDPNNNQPGGAWIGQSNIPWSAFGVPAEACVTWVQAHGHNYHFGEHGEQPVCLTTPEPTPEPEPEPTPVVTPHIQDYVGACDAAFILDNFNSTIPVTYFVNGQRYIVDAGTRVATDADGTRIQPNAEGVPYIITTDTGKHWEFPGAVCIDDNPVEPPVTEPEPPVTEPEPEPTEPPVVEPEPTDPPVVEEPQPEPPVTAVPEEPVVEEQPVVQQEPVAVVTQQEEERTYVAPAPVERERTLAVTGVSDESKLPQMLGAGALLLLGAAFIAWARWQYKNRKARDDVRP